MSDRLAGVDAEGLEGLSEQARITAAVLGVPYIESEQQAEGGVGGSASAAEQQAVGWGEGGGEGFDAAEAQALMMAGQGVDPVTAWAAAQIEEESILVRVSADLGKGSGEDPNPSTASSSSSTREGGDSGSSGSDRPQSSTGFSGGRVYDSMGSADFAWGVGEVMKESGYYSYRSMDDSSNPGIGRRSSTGHRGAGDDDASA